MLTCGFCGKGCGTLNSLASHASVKHRGIAREVWQPGYVRKRPAMNLRKPQPEPEPPKPTAEVFVGMPWPKMPRTAEDADRVAMTIGKAASSLASGDPVFDVLMSQRDYYLALGARMRQLEATA